MKKFALCFAFLFSLSGCSNPFAAVETSMKTAWQINQGTPDLLDCKVMNDRAFTDGFDRIIFKCELKRSTKDVELIEVVDGNPEDSFEYGLTVLPGQSFRAANYFIDAPEGMVQNPALAENGKICATMQCPKYEVLKSGFKFYTVLSKPGSAVPKTLSFKYALWSGKKNVWLGTSKVFNLEISADPELVNYEAGKIEVQADIDRQAIREQDIKQAFDEGYAFIWENSADFLTTMPGLLTSFDIKGQPIKSEIKEFCNSLHSETLINRGHLSSSTNSARKSWNKGCYQAGMKIEVSDINGGND